MWGREVLRNVVRDMFGTGEGQIATGDHTHLFDPFRHPARQPFRHPTVRSHHERIDCQRVSWDSIRNCLSTYIHR
jgi:hypothetical protein